MMKTWSDVIVTTRGQNENAPRFAARGIVFLEGQDHRLMKLVA